MGRLSWIALPIAVLTLIVVPLTTRTDLRAEVTKEAVAEEREWGEAVNGCRVSIQLKDYDDTKYGPVTLSIIVENTGKGAVTYSESWAYTDFVLTVRDSKGEEVPLTQSGKHVRKSEEAFRRIVVKLAPGQWKEYRLVASRMHDMTLEGTYTMTATLKIRDAEGEKLLPVKSNTITVKVPPQISSSVGPSSNDPYPPRSPR